MDKIKWNSKSIDLLLLYFNDNKTYREIGKLIGRSSGSVRNKLNSLSLKYTDKYSSITEYFCENCGNGFTDKTSVKRKFCSHTCSTTYANKLKPKRKKVYKTCKFCGVELINNQNTFCSTKCHFDYDKNETIIKIERGDCSVSENQYKKYLIDKYGDKCMKCGWCEINPKTKLVPIQLEHKDGNSENHNLNNLELLCPNCHSLTSTYGALNKGNGRAKRRENRQKNKIAGNA